MLPDDYVIQKRVEDMFSYLTNRVSSTYETLMLKELKLEIPLVTKVFTKVTGGRLARNDLHFEHLVRHVLADLVLAAIAVLTTNAEANLEERLTNATEGFYDEYGFGE